MSTPFTNLTKMLMLVSILIFSNQNLQAQTIIGRQKVEQFNSDPWGGKFYALTWLPADYHSNTNNYPIIIYLHGSGENGTGAGGLYSLLNHSLPAKIAQGWDPQATNPVDGQNYKFIVVSPQASQWSPNFHNLSSLIPDIIARYRVDPSRIYVTGVSAGGAGTWATVTNGSTFAQQFAAVVPVAAAGTNTSSETTQIPLVGGTYGVKVWNICGMWDSFWTLANNFTNQINSASPAPSVPAVVSGLPGGHEWHVWNTTYDPNWRSNAQNKNIYEWMLQYTRGGVTAPPAPLPLPNPLPLPLPAAATALPGKVEAESFSLMQGIQTEGTSDAGGGQNVGYIDNGDWMEYLVNPTSTGAYTANIRIATPNTGGTLQLRKADGTALATVTIPATGGWQTWQTVSVPVNFTITGNQSIRVVSTSATNWNINWVEFIAGVTNPTPTPTPPPPTSTAPTSGRVEAESHSAQSGTQKEGTADAGGGENVGWIDNGDWMEYVINPTTTGNYTFSFRLASTATGGQLAVKKADGSTLATVNVPNTGGWQTWQTATGTVALTAGQQTIRIQSVNAANWNINWFEFATGTATPPPPPPTTPAPTGTVVLPGKVEAEAYTNMYGIQTENTNDNGGGLNVGWIDYMDWMEYSVDAGAGGTYTIDFRIATPNTTAKVEILNGAGQVISTMNLQSTGGYQSWQNATTTINLAAGVQTIRFRSIGGGAFNINYINFTSNAVTAGRGITGETEIEKETVNTELAMQVYPNPVVSQMVMKLNNEYKGEVILEVIGMDGVVKQAQRLQKSNTGAAQFYLSLSKLQAGNYVVRVVMGTEVVSKTIIKR